MSSPKEPIAIIGSGCRFAGSSDRPSKLWDLLKQPVDVAREIPSDRFNVDTFWHPIGARGGSTNVKEAYFITDRNVRHFDAQFFSMHPSEADAIDPQHRHLLEVVYEGLEDAGLTLESLHGSNTAVFVGHMCNDYSVLTSRDFDFIPKYSAPGIAPSNASSRISYFFNWHGPTLTIDTACSSSLIALAQAVQTLREGTSDVAIAAGTNLILDPLSFVSESNIGMLSPNGRSRMWDAGADGYARGEGVAAVILKKLSAAIRDGDTIDCIVREAGCNHDGKTQGITMPSGAAQAALIRQTYAKAGLNPELPADRCQYFEAHGTGTPAGDPEESSALNSAFFGSGEQHDADDVLYVGSAKTVIGHTEGTAGLAGVLKAALALKHGIIPPNLHFDQLSPLVKPFYGHLRIPKEAIPWPALPSGVPRRASVNSFGFGGSNAHAILETYEPSENQTIHSDGQLSIVPFVFSANNESSLVNLTASYLSYFRDNKTAASLDNLRHTLACRRSALPHKISFSASTMDELVKNIESRLAEQANKAESSSFGARSSQKSSILGVFTGQGAQWPAMGIKLIESQPAALSLIASLDESLQTLPEVADRPQWRILDELRKEKDSGSRIAEAALSQPLCTAVQLVLVEIMRAAGIKFTAVVGHSSGEIAAAYTAGFLSATDAIRIAYYRGLHAKAAGGANGCKGAMMAVGTSFEDAKELCALEDFEDRLCVAASNSPDSVTLSGDVDAIEEAKDALDQEGKFTRVLVVDTAYHSHHMRSCAEGFEKSLAACNITILQPGKDAPTWLSSVREKTTMTASSDLTGSYWSENMTNTVLFSQAIEQAVETHKQFDLSLELGPHPALKKPTTETFEAAGVKAIEHIGTLVRGKHDVHAISQCLGAIWAHLGSAAVNWQSLISDYCGIEKAMPVIRDLPLYSWNHSREFWTESRTGKLFRTQQDTVHELLGKKLPDGTDDEIRWRNVFNPKIHTWLPGHAIQGVPVFPATGYIGLAMEAAMEVAAGHAIQSIELADLHIDKAIAIDETAGSEVITTLGGISRSKDTINAHFVCRSPLNNDTGRMAINASGDLTVYLGEATSDTLVPREHPAGDLMDVDIDRFYDVLSTLGYGYSGPFRGLGRLQRRMGFASGSINNSTTLGSRPLLFHPGLLDTSVHSLFASFGVAGDGQWSLQVPSKIRRVTLIPSLCGENLLESVGFDCTMSAPRSGDIAIIAADGIHKCIEIDGLEFVPFSPPTAADDRCLFSKVTWARDRPDGDEAAARRALPEEKKKFSECERVSFYYLRNLNDTIDQAERDRLQIADHWKALFDYSSYVIKQVKEHRWDYTSPKWLNDSHDDIIDIMEPYGDHDADFSIIRAVGEHMPAVVRGETTMLEVMTKDNMLENYYRHGLGCEAGNITVANFFEQITKRFPHMDILEIGAGTGGATYEVFSRGDQVPFTSYTYTDVSAGFFGNANAKFNKWTDKMIFKVLDIEKPPKEQGFTEHSYDLILASHCLHATYSLENTLKNARSLLKPGGYLVVLEIVEIDTMPIGLIMGGLPGWWVGHHEGRRYSPNITLAQWKKLLKKTDFAGIDTFTPMLDPRPFTASVFVAQAVDDRVNLLRRPLASSPDDINFDHLVLLGGDGMLTSDVMEELEAILRPRCRGLVMASSLDELNVDEFPPLTSVLSLTDIDKPVFKDINEEGWEKLKKLLSSSDCLLWVTHGAWCEQPDAGTMAGLLRSITYEHAHQRPQLLEICDPKELSAKLLAEQLMTIKLGQQWRASGTGTDILHTIEPEHMLENGVLKILRQMPDTVANNRYNSARREITKDVDIELGGDVCVRWNDQRYTLHETKLPGATSEGLSRVRVERSVLESVRTPFGMLFLSLGTDIQNAGARVLALSDENASTVLSSDSVVVANPAPLSDEEYLTAVSTYLIGQQILSRVPAGATILIHEPSPLLAAVLKSDNKDVKVSFTTTRPELVGEDGWVQVHSRMPSRTLKRVLPSQVDVFLDMSDINAPEKRIGAKILEVLPETCQEERLSSLVSKKSTVYGTVNGGNSDLLQKANSFVHAASQAWSISKIAKAAISVPVIDLPKVDHSATSLFASIDWRSGQSVIPTSFEPIDSSKDLFQDNKTYWMVGLAGDLGQSLCDWMVLNGARYIVLTSRTVNSKVPESWLKAHAAQGVTIKLIAGDVTDLDSLTSVRDEIEKTLPTIRGVANGSLVLRDRLYLNTDFETFQTVMRPKTVGTSNLDRLFSEDTLDWFIGFSSIVATVGNPGQSSYSAGNLYVKAVINQRRARSLPGATIDIAPVLGVGYVERERKAAGVMTAKMVEKLEGGAQPISESALHQLFAEAIVAGRPESGRHSDIVTGVRTLKAEDMNQAFWAANLKFSHFIRDVGTGGNQADDGEVDRVSVKTKLLEASSVDEAASIIRAVLTLKLNKTLQYPADQEIPDSTPLIDMGIDSLIAVEVRTWFLQELEVDMPMLKILGGSTIVDMVSDAIARLPESLASRLQNSGEEQADEGAQQTVPVPVVAVGSDDEDDSSAKQTRSTASEAGSSSSGTAPSAPPTPLSMPTPGELDAPKTETEFQFPTKDRPSFEPEIVRTEPMSFGQTRFWFLKQYLEDQSTSNIAFYFRIDGAFKPDKLRRALELACQRHEALRTCFYAKDDTPVQGIMRQSAIEMEYHRVSNQAEVRSIYRSVRDHVFDIRNGDTLRLVLCEESPTSFYFILGYDHIAMDGFSWEILFAELQAHYRGAYVPSVSRQYAQWTIKQRNDVMGATLAADRQYWRNQFPALPAVLPLLPMAKVTSRGSLKAYEVNRASAKLDHQLADLVKTVSQANKVSPFHFHFAVFKTLLARLSGSTDICIGMADASRMDPADGGVIGLLLNLLPLRFDCSKDQIFAASLQEMRTKVYGAMAHSQVPFNTIIDDLKVPRSTNHHPLFQAFIEYRPAQTLKFADLKGELPEDHTSFARTPYDVELNVLEDHGGGVTVSIGCQSHLYSEHAARLVLRSYLALLKSFAAEPQRRVDEPQVYAPEDALEALTLGKGECLQSAWPKTISHRIADMVEAYPYDTALKDTLGNCLTYKAMAERVNTIQAALSEAGVSPGLVVGVSMQPSTDWVCCLLAVLRQGAVFVPLDCSQGALRLQQIVDACSPAAILINSPKENDWPGVVVDIGKLASSPSGRSQVPNMANPDQPAVMLFTSGTTGVPKGVLLQHAALSNVFEGVATKYDTGRQTVLQQSAFSFDMSLEQTFLALCNGGTLVVVDQSIRGDSRAIMKAIAQEGVTYTKATPAEYSSWFRNGAPHVKGNTTWRYIFAGGDRMTQTMLSELRGLGLSPDVKLLNSYGPVEGTIIATKMLLPVHQDNEGKPIPVGLPLPNYSIYIVDEDLNLLPPEVPGEIIIGGQGVAIGYLDDDGKKFIANPWADAEYIKRGWSKMYRTGDKGHLTKRGELIFHGRIAGDTQVKLRGIRLELEDVERNILKAANGDLSEVVCTIREGADGAGSNYLVAFVVLSSQADGASAESDYLTNLRERLPLPQYMKPSAMVVLKTLPLTKHGKIDRSAIGAMSLTTNVAGEGQDEAELSELEVQISNIWRQLLPKETMPPSLKRSSDFFMVGGSSLVLVEVQSLVRTEFNIDLSLRDLYEATALSEMADKVREALNAKTINWALETAPPQPHELAELSGPSQPLRSTNLEVIMTGATGHLGGFVLQRLISDPAIAKIHCVAVRDASGLKFHSDKLVIYSGDLSQPNLGLPADTAAYLAATADAVVHSGATRLNWETYESMRPTNLLSTRTLIRLAAPRRLPVHFVSSGGVFPADVAPSEDSAAEHQPPAVGADGYVASKWASERLLERSAEQLGVPVHIYRTVRADEGTFPEELPEEILAGMAAATVEAGVMLDHGGHAWVGFFDLVSAPGVADNIVGGVVAEAASQNVGGEERGGGNRGTVGYANHKGIYRVWKGEQLDSLVYRPEIQERLGRFKMVPPQIWLGEMKRAGFPWMMGASAAAYKGLVKNRR